MKRYYTGKPCKYGHAAERLVSTYQCVECKKENSAKLRDSGYFKDYDKANRSRLNSNKSAWRAMNRDRDRQTWLAWVDRNRERILQVRRAWRAKNRARVRLHSRASDHKRRSQQRGGMSSSELSAWLQRQRKICYWCGKKCSQKFEVDHYIPLSRGGEHVASNLVIACKSCNSRKHARDPYEFAAQVGRLF